MTNRWECCVGSGCRVGGTLRGLLLRSRSGQCELDYWCCFLVAAWGLQDSETPRNSAWAHTREYHDWENIRLSECLYVWGAPRIGPFGPGYGYVTYSGRKKWKNNYLQRGVLGQHRQVFSVLEFYSLQDVLWGFVTLQTVYMQKKLHNTQGDG